MTHQETMKAVLQASKEPLSARDLMARTMRLMNETGDPDAIARACGFDPDDLFQCGENFTPVIRNISSREA